MHTQIQKRVLDPLELQLQAVVSWPTWIPVVKSRPLAEQQTFLTAEPAPQPPTRPLKIFSFSDWNLSNLGHKGIDGR